MSRAPFTKTVTLYDGPGTATPGFPRVVDAPCRLVSDLFFVDLNPPMDGATAYFTIDAAVPRGPDTTEGIPGIWKYDFTKADRAEFSGLAPLLFAVARVETCTWPDQFPYWRAQVVLLDPNPPVACPLAYANEYQLDDENTSTTHTLSRVTPLTWAGDGYVVTAEVEWVNPDICLSKWTVVKLGVEWVNINWDGGDDGVFYDYVGPLLPIHVYRP